MKRFILSALATFSFTGVALGSTYAEVITCKTDGGKTLEFNVYQESDQKADVGNGISLTCKYTPGDDVDHDGDGRVEVPYLSCSFENEAGAISSGTEYIFVHKDEYGNTLVDGDLYLQLFQPIAQEVVCTPGRFI